jgi:imidazolonepropionase-like amidohydrolase
MGVIAQLRQAMFDAQDYMQRTADTDRRAKEWDAKPAAERKGDRPTPPKRDMKLEALIPYLRGEKPVVIGADEARDLEVALRLADEFKLKVILNGLPYAQSQFDRIAKMKLPVIISAFYDAPEANERYDTVYSVPAELSKRGVKIAFATQSSPHYAYRLPNAAGNAVAFGLPWEEAMKAVTLYPAQIWGVADKLGSLEAGKLANVVISTGDPLDLRSEVKQVFINGEAIPMVSKHTRLRDQYAVKK